MKKGKEVNLKLNKKFKTYYGTIDNKELKTIYVGISTWIKPLVEGGRVAYGKYALKKTLDDVIKFQEINRLL